jgi:hypothetical protein
MELFFSVIISGMAVGYVTELAIKLFDTVVPKWVTRILTTIPVAILMNYLLGVTGWELLPSGLASGFFALVMMSVVARVSSSKR